MIVNLTVKMIVKMIVKMNIKLVGKMPEVGLNAVKLTGKMT